MEDFFTDYGSTTVKLSNIVTNVRDTPSRLECHWCCFYHSLKSSDYLWLNKARDCGMFFGQTLSNRGRPRRTSRIWKTKRSHLSQFPKVLFFVNFVDILKLICHHRSNTGIQVTRLRLFPSGFRTSMTCLGFRCLERRWDCCVDQLFYVCHICAPRARWGGLWLVCGSPDRKD